MTWAQIPRAKRFSRAFVAMAYARIRARADGKVYYTPMFDRIQQRTYVLVSRSAFDTPAIRKRSWAITWEEDTFTIRPTDGQH
jgi:hypothetical protein